MTFLITFSIAVGCPNACSDHGKCRSLEEVFLPYKDVFPPPAILSSWERHRIMTCVCDAPFTGPDCSQRLCPFGDDPLSSDGQMPAVQIQRLTLEFEDLPVPPRSDGELALIHKTPQGGTYSTESINAIFNPASAPSQIKRALEALPDFSVPLVQVESHPDNDLSTRSRKYDIRFSHPRNAGRQKLLQCVRNLGCDQPGCQPRLKQLRVEATAGSVGSNSVTWSHNVVLSRVEESLPVPGSGTFQTGVEIEIVPLGDKKGFRWRVNHGVGVGDAFTGRWSDILHIQSDMRSVPIVHGLRVDFSEDGDPIPGLYYFYWSIPRCSVEEVEPPSPLLESMECGGRGKCNRRTGVCRCFPGYAGEACSEIIEIL